MTIKSFYRQQQLITIAIMVTAVCKIKGLAQSISWLKSLPVIVFMIIGSIAHNL